MNKMKDKLDMFMYFLSVIMLAHCNSCDDGEEKCPDHLPFCTPVGCVFRCPDGAYVNGSNCVQDCGEGYIFNSSCVHSCPGDYALIEEQINFKFKKLRFCRSRCDTDTFAYNTTCIKSCPSASKYVEDGLCTNNCSVNKPLHQTITSDNRLIGIECLGTCNKTSNHPFQSVNECVSKCQDGQVVYNGTCLQSCPTHTQVLLNQQMCLQLGTCQNGWPDQKYCSDKCPESVYVYNNTCVEKCPETAKHSLDGRCVNKCPDQQYAYYIYFVYGYADAIECCKQCPYPLRSNNYTFECVDVCPKGLKNFDRACLLDCPNNTYIETAKETGELSCVSECQKYSLDNLCVDSCPANAKYLHGSRCVPECPKSNPNRVKNPFRCLKECPENLKTNTLTNDCVARCPGEMFNFQKTCLIDCPEETFMAVKEMKCVQVCDKYEFNGTCVDSCPRYSVNAICVDQCPGPYKVAYGGLCQHDCPENTCVTEDGFNCTDKCIRDTKHNKLVYKCPDSVPYTRKYMSESQCVSTCEKNEVLSNFTCINVTDCNRAVLSHGKCADECPESYLYLPDSDSMLISKEDGYQYNLEDVDNNPCKPVTDVYLGLVSLGLFLVLAIWLLAVFLSTRPVNIPVCTGFKQKLTRFLEVRCGRTEVHLNSDQHSITVPNDAQDDVPLLDAVTDNTQSQDTEDLPLLTGATNNVQSRDVPLSMGITNNVQTRDVPLLTEITDNVQSQDVPLLIDIIDNIQSQYLPSHTEDTGNVQPQEADIALLIETVDNGQPEESKEIPSFGKTVNESHCGRHTEEYNLVAANGHDELNDEIKDDVSILSTAI